MGLLTALLMDPSGKILWANREAHRNVGLPPGGLLGRNYLEFCPPEIHGPLLELHRRKLRGQTVRFPLDLGPGKAKLQVTSGPVRLGRKTYLFVTARPAGRGPGADATWGLLAAGEALSPRRARADLNTCLIGAMKDEAARLRGRIRLNPVPTPPVSAHPWRLRLLLRYLLLRSLPPAGRLQVHTGNRGRRVWMEIHTSRIPSPRDPGLTFCRRSLRKEGGILRLDRHRLRLSFPVA